MKKIRKFMKAFGAFTALGLLLLFMVVSCVADFFPNAIPDWMHIALLIISVPFWIAEIVHFVITECTQRRNKKNH